MPISKVLFSSNSDEWETPQSLFDELNKEFNFTLDPCATKENAKCVTYFTKEDNGLIQDWGINCNQDEAVFVNPPYSDIYSWVSKAFDEQCKVVMLIPARTCTRWFHEFIWDRVGHKPRYGAQVRFIKGRLKFNGSKNSAPFPSMVVVFN